jgi:glycosyltransferase involved in cell wall biosynthesis
MVCADAISPGRIAISRNHLLHVVPSFGIGGVELGIVRFINHFGMRVRHSVMALNNNFEAAKSLSGNLDVTLLAPRRPTRTVLRAVVDGALVLRHLRPDLLLTYNWGAIEWAMANRLLPICRHVHFEAGFGKEEADKQIRRRVLFRRWALTRCASLVVPSRTLEDLARHVWRIPAERIAYVPIGVDLERFSGPPRDILPAFARRVGGLVIGTVAQLRPEKNIGRLLRVFAILGNSVSVRLVIAGDGVERPKLEALARELGVADRVVFTGQVAPEAVLGSFDIFALSSDTEQMPNALLEAMATSRAVAAVDVGDVKRIVCEANRDFIVERDDAPAFAAAIMRLLGDPAKRAALGHQNRERVAAEFSQAKMFAAYAKILGLGSPECDNVETTAR